MRQWVKAIVPFGVSVFMLGGILISPAAAEPQAYCVGRTYPVNCWVIEPNVKQSATEYPQIQFEPGEHVYIEAGGCVQTGGAGRTWKRYVDPAADNDLYHGLINIPSATAGMVRLLSVVNQTVIVRDYANLWLGYEDDGYSDNGYWGHDDGTGDQCKNVGPAWVHLTITR